MHAPPRHRDDSLEQAAGSEVFGVYDSIDEAEWAAGVLTHHGIGVDGISLIEPAGDRRSRRHDRARTAQRDTIAVLTELVQGSGRLFGWSDGPTTVRDRSSGGRPIMAVLHGRTDDADLAQRILADHAARAGRV